jgi:hypothetical protein
VIHLWPSDVEYIERTLEALERASEIAFQQWADRVDPDPLSFDADAQAELLEEYGD